MPRIIDIEIDDIATFKAIIEILNGAVPEANAEIIRDINAHTESFNKKQNANKQTNNVSNTSNKSGKNTDVNTNTNKEDSDSEDSDNIDESEDEDTNDESEAESEAESEDLKHKSRSGKATIPKNVMLNKKNKKDISESESDQESEPEDESDADNNDIDDVDINDVNDGMVIDSDSDGDIAPSKSVKKTSSKVSTKKTEPKTEAKKGTKGKTDTKTGSKSDKTKVVAKGKRGRQPKKDTETETDTETNSVKKPQKKAGATSSDSKTKTTKTTKTTSVKASNNTNSNNSKSGASSNSNPKNDKKEEVKSNADNPGQIKILTTDTNQVMIIYISLEGCAFKKFVVRPERFTIGLNLDELHKYIKNVDKEGVMTMHMDSEDTQHVVFDVKSANLATTESICELRVVNLPAKNDRKIEVDCSMVIRVNCSAFHKACKDLLQFSRYVEITCDPSQMALTCKGELSTHKRIFRVDGTQDGVVIKTMAKEGSNGPEIIRLVFDLTYINMMYKCSTLCDDMEIYLNSESIMFLRYGIKLMGRMVVGISPTNAGKTSNKEDYDMNNEEFYNDDDEIELLE